MKASAPATRARLLPVFFIAFLAACAHQRAGSSPSQKPESGSPYTVFADRLRDIGQGDVKALTELGEANEESADFLNTLYLRYGPVSRIYSLSFNQVAGISRGVFLAVHRGGPFLWDLVRYGDDYTMVRGGMDLEPFLREAHAPQPAVDFGRDVMADINAGRIEALFSRIVCNCVTQDSLEREIESLLSHTGDEQKLTYVGAEGIPGTEEQMLRLHFLSEREQDRLLGFQMILWKTDGKWALNGVKWSSEELIPK